MSEMGRYLGQRAVANPRRFSKFPRVWGRRVKWFDIKSGEYISAKQAERIFKKGKPVGYVANHFTYAIVYDGEGQEPSV